MHKLEPLTNSLCGTLSSIRNYWQEIAAGGVCHFLHGYNHSLINGSCKWLITQTLAWNYDYNQWVTDKNDVIGRRTRAWFGGKKDLSENNREKKGNDSV